MKVIVIDYKMGNLGSVRRSLEECGANVLISQNPEDLKEASHIVLPGVGAFHTGMTNLEREGWIAPIKDAIKSGTPLLGICLGMQLLAEKGNEGSACEGLGFLGGEVKRLQSKNSEEKIPHVGWNEVYPTKQNRLFQGIPSGTDFYFVHSYCFKVSDEDREMAYTPYCGRFTSAVMEDNIFGVQFHPEKSSKPGLRLLKNFLTM